MDNKQKIKQAYKEIAVVGRSLPLSLKVVGEQAGLTLAEVRAEFPGSLDIQQGIWADYLRTTLETLEDSPEFAEYLVREKMLGFYFTFFELIAEDREFILLFKDKLGVWNYIPEFLQPFKDAFIEFVSMLLAEGASTEEVAERMVLGNQYPGWHWPQFMFLLNGWVNDPSADYSRTDQAIEKSVNLGFDIMGRNLFDSAFDFFKFVVTRR
ncbi:MAG: TetR family transcriptional regulator C-terminal domain-containing protein [Bacteroidota bacterium]